MKQQGFTLIEMMVVVVLIAILMTGVTNLLLAGLRGGGKTGVQTNLREQGNAIITAMERGIRYGVEFVTINPQTCFNGVPEKIQFKRQVALPGGSYAWRLVQYQYEFASGAVVYSVDYDDNGAFEDNEKQPLNGQEVDVVQLVFVCEPPTSSTPPKVGIKLTVSDPVTFETLDFQTTVAVRNIDE
jgi:prepilin-type N-terminal cleavage/methylation domain-containing protein